MVGIADIPVVAYATPLLLTQKPSLVTTFLALCQTFGLPSGALFASDACSLNQVSVDKKTTLAFHSSVARRCEKIYYDIAQTIYNHLASRK